MGIIGRIKQWRRNRTEKSRREYEWKSCEIYQVCEYDGELWLTHNNGLVCPCSMLSAGPVNSVRKMRELYVKRMEGRS